MELAFSVPRKDKLKHETLEGTMYLEMTIKLNVD